MQKSEQQQAATSCELVETRVYDAPPELVWKAWTNPDSITHWWGPRGFSTTTSEMNVTPGGQWRFVMHGPDGVDYPNLITYDEVDEPKRLVYTHRGDGEYDDVHFHATVTFEPKDGGTAMTFCMVFGTPEELARVVKEVGADQGLRETVDRLAEFLAER
jgi:uncharacterized protein YndB with AHSA1/START domain